MSKILDQYTNDSAFAQKMSDSPTQTLRDLGINFDQLRSVVGKTGTDDEVAAYCKQCLDQGIQWRVPMKVLW